jgi:hypothetical protein
MNAILVQEQISLARKFADILSTLRPPVAILAKKEHPQCVISSVLS